MTNLPCELIRDLLPLYLDGVCSEQSKAAVEAHLQDCEACKTEYQRLLDAERLAPTPKPDAAQTEEKQIKALRRVKRSLNKKRLLAALLAIVAATGIAVGLFLFASTVFVILPYDETKMRVEKMTPQTAEMAGLGAETALKDTLDLQVSEDITEYYAYLSGQHFTLEENGETIHAACYYFGSSLPDYLAHGGKGNFRERRLQQGLEDSFPDGKMHWGLSTIWTDIEFSDEPVELGMMDGCRVTAVEAPPEPGASYIVTKEGPLDRIYYLGGPHFSRAFSDLQKAVEQYGVLIWEREA